MDISVFPLQRMAEYSRFFNRQSDEEKINWLLLTMRLMSSSTTFCVATGRGGEGRGGRSLLAARPGEAAGSDQTSSSLPLPARLPSKSLDTSLSSVCLFSFSTSFKPSPLYSSSSSLYLPLPLTPSPRSYSQSAVPALLLLLLRG